MASKFWLHTAAALVLAASVACGGSNSEAPPSDLTTGAGGEGGAGQGGMSAGGKAPTGGGGSQPIACTQAEGPEVSDSHLWVDGADQAEMTITGGEDCARSYSLATTASLRADAWGDDPVPNPRAFPELEGQPVVRSGHTMFDGLYALALHEVREASVDAISNWAFDGGAPLACPPGGCFETGKLWSYVWTRDTAYAVVLGLGLLDPARARNSLEFKLSEKRGGGGLEIVQDTGTGGSWPISTDRVVWALGAWELMKYLDGAAREAFAAQAYEAMKNTAERDRLVAYDASDGLYRGEQSFLDWREQSYPGWVAGDPIQIGMSKSLSTNVGHLRLLEITASLAQEAGLSADAAKYQAWADALRAALGTLFVSDDGMFSTYVTTSLDPAPARRYDLLGQALAVLAGVGSEAERKQAVASYPHLPKGPPVIWPQQQLTPIYHNRGIWPFVTALWAKAAKATQNPAVVDHAVRSLMRGAALHLSNMENFEAASGAAWLDDGAYSGPVINSTRQLWSVAGYASMVQDVVFGFEADQQGIRFSPFLPQSLRASLFADVSSIALSHLPYKGKRVTVVLELSDAPLGGALVAESVSLDGEDVGTGFVPAAKIADGSVFTVKLTGVAADGDIRALSESDLSDYQNLSAPKTPAITSVSEAGGALVLGLDAAGESAGDVTFDVYRDGALVAENLPGATSSWTDPNSGDWQTKSHCYTLETRFVSSDNRSQRAKPACWWGPGAERITTLGADAFTANGGSYVFNHGKSHYEAWGDPSHTLELSGVTVEKSGSYLLQLVAGNGGPVDSGVTCALKRIEVTEQGNVIASGYLAMPHLGTWNAWAGSDFLPLTLDASKSYSIHIGEDDSAFNMSELEHFAPYDGIGGKTGRFNQVNIAEVKLLGLELP